MPKSYLSDEPACRRAAQCNFDPYWQAALRLRALSDMGHVVDKVELIVLGGSFMDYPASYRRWFVAELFRALNDGVVDGDERAVLDTALLPSLEADVTWADLSSRQQTNESAVSRAIGLCVETRPDQIDGACLRELRQLGCTKVQIGVQSLDQRVLDLNRRGVEVARMAEAFALLRLYGFKIHAHFMLNLLGSAPSADVADYRRLMTEADWLPDEVKLYPCVLVAGTGLCAHFDDGSWQPYEEDTLLDVLQADVLATPPFVRISRMVRDISAHDIVAGNKKCNLRQMVEARIEAAGGEIREMRWRELAGDTFDKDALSLKTISYATTVSREYFLQWVSATGRLVGFLRLSLPNADAVAARAAELPQELQGAADDGVGGGGKADGQDGVSTESALGLDRGSIPAGLPQPAAMIRELHVYGRVSGLGSDGAGSGEGAQHRGLGRQLVREAAALARAEGYGVLQVISAVGTRQYYRALGFSDGALYQHLPL
jgi:elongator complex protein 3